MRDRAKSADETLREYLVLFSPVVCFPVFIIQNHLHWIHRTCPSRIYSFSGCFLIIFKNYTYISLILSSPLASALNILKGVMNHQLIRCASWLLLSFMFAATKMDKSLRLNRKSVITANNAFKGQAETMMRWMKGRRGIS